MSERDISVSGRDISLSKILSLSLSLSVSIYIYIYGGMYFVRLQHSLKDGPLVRKSRRSTLGMAAGQDCPAGWLVGRRRSSLMGCRWPAGWPC